jgi:hypothetical protein
LIRGRLESGEREKTEPWLGKKSMNPCCVVVTEVRGSLRVLILHKGKEQGRRRRRRRRSTFSRRTSTQTFSGRGRAMQATKKRMLETSGSREEEGW